MFGVSENEQPSPLLTAGDVVTEVDYPASIGPANAKPGTWAAGMSRSRNVGKHNLAEAIRRTANIPVRANGF